MNPFQHGALRLAAFLVVAASGALAHAQAGRFDFYYNVYPEWKLQQFGTPSTAGTNVGNMGTLRNDTRVLSKNANPKARVDDQQWSNSYIGFRGQFESGRLAFGYDLQGLVDFKGSIEHNFRTRDAFVYLEYPGFGRLSLGKMDTMYKEAGDPVRMFGISSGNIVSTSKVVSGVGWKAAGETSFNNRVDHMMMWVSPAVAGFNVGVSHSVLARPVVSVPRLDPTLTAAALQWHDGAWYAAMATEVHRNWLPVSLGDPAAATSIRNSPVTVTSRDQGWRATLGWTQGPWRFGADAARLRYAENDPVAPAGKFRSYANLTGQASIEYQWNQWRFGANHARASAGSCALSAGIACSTNGLGGDQTSLGVMLNLNSITNVFALAVHTRNNPAAQYGSSAQGANTDAYAFGVKLVLK